MALGAVRGQRVDQRAAVRVVEVRAVGFTLRQVHEGARAGGGRGLEIVDLVVAAIKVNERTAAVRCDCSPWPAWAVDLGGSRDWGDEAVAQRLQGALAA